MLPVMGAHTAGKVSANPSLRLRSLFFFFNDTATTEIYTLSLHDALPISLSFSPLCHRLYIRQLSHFNCNPLMVYNEVKSRSEEHTSELQSHSDLVCRLLLEKKKP